MSLVSNLVSFFPEVKKPEQKKLGFKEKLKWTLIILIAFFILSVIPLFGLGSNELSRFAKISVYIFYIIRGLCLCILRRFSSRSCTQRNFCIFHFSINFNCTIN